MRIIPSRFRQGFLSFDALFSIIPILLMLFFVMNLSSFLVRDVAEYAHKQQVFDKLVSIADYTVKSGAVVSGDHIKYPNWLDRRNFDVSYVENLRTRAELSALYISLEEPRTEFDFCIYRVVVIGTSKEIAKLFVCGE